MPKFQINTKRLMDIGSVSGYMISEKEKIMCHWSAKHGWKNCPAGFGRSSKGTVMVLYRGVNLELYEQFAGALIPKENKPFIKPAEWGRFEWGNAYWGKCEANAIVEHQQHQAGYSTSGISTTPHLNRAIFYATHDEKYSYGYVYVIDEALCQIHKVAIYKVKDYVPSPSIPEDDEVILVARDFGVIPRALVIEIRKVSNSGTRFSRE